jgi:hypothetical protein
MTIASRNNIPEKPRLVLIISVAVSRRLIALRLEIFQRFPVVRAASERRLLLPLPPGTGSFECGLYRAAFSSSLLALLLRQPNFCSHCLQVSVHNPWSCCHSAKTNQAADARLAYQAAEDLLCV